MLGELGRVSGRVWLRRIPQRADDPRSRGKALTGPLTGLWRYRIGDWRVVVDIYDDRLVILALDIEHRSRGDR